MKLSKLVATPEGLLQKIVVTTSTEGLPLVAVTPLTVEEIHKVADTYNAVADAAEGSNHLPYQMTFQLLKESDIAGTADTIEAARAKVESVMGNDDWYHIGSLSSKGWV